jgi:hypothetical protein
LRGRINVSFGIGTNLTCDIPGVEPMSIVLKMTACNGQPVAKISDEPARLTAKTRISSPICDTFSKFLPFPAYLARSEFMQAVQREIAEQLKVQPPFADEAALKAEVARRITFIQDCLVNSGLKTLVLGISGGVDSLTAGLLASVPCVNCASAPATIAQVHRRAPAVQTQFDERRPGLGGFIEPDERHTEHRPGGQVAGQ